MTINKFKKSVPPSDIVYAFIYTAYRKEEITQMENRLVVARS